MNSRRQQLEQSLSLSRDELAILAPLVQKAVMPRIDLIRLERQVSALDGEIRTIRTAIPRLKSAQQEDAPRIVETRLTATTAYFNALNTSPADITHISPTLFDTHATLTIP